MKTRNKNKNHDKILLLAKSKLNIIEALVYRALIDMEISHAEFITILKEIDKHEKMKENVRKFSEKLEEKQEKMRLNSLNSRKTSLEPRDLLYQKFLFFFCIQKMVNIDKETYEQKRHRSNSR